MSKKSDYEKVGGGTYGVYRKKKKPNHDWVWMIIGGIVFLMIIGSIIPSS